MAYKIEVDKSKCIGCGGCEAVCPKSFKLEGGKAKVLNEKVEKLSCEKDAEEACPVGAISVREAW